MHWYFWYFCNDPNQVSPSQLSPPHHKRKVKSEGQAQLFLTSPIPITKEVEIKRDLSKRNQI
jgi:hypothetical protein